MRAYDRPIPRRLLEEAGVPRHAFGMAKKAVEIVVKIEGTRVLRPDSLADFEEFCDRHWGPWMAVKDRALDVARFVQKHNKRLNAKLTTTIKINFGATVRLPSLLPAWIRRLCYGPVGRDHLLFHWSVSKLLPRYQAACRIAPVSAGEIAGPAVAAPIAQPFPELGSSAAR
jgi:hypothetical protein